MSTRKILLLNPPSPELLIRDYYCSKTTKSNYIFQPVDLIIQSGYLAQQGEVKLIDAVVDRLSFDACKRAVLDYAPDWVFFLTGAVSWEYDFPFLEDLKRCLPGSRWVGSGDIFQEEGERWLHEFPFIDGVVKDFSNDDVAAIFLGEFDRIQNGIYRQAFEVKSKLGAREKRAFFDIPIPRQDLFINPRYHFSFTRSEPFATVLTDFGCPYPCSFCIQSTLGFKYRSVENVMQELRQLKALGVREVFFQDQTWGTHKERNLELCQRMVDEKLNLGWVTFSRVDVIQEDTLKAWKAAGCHTLMFGVEFADAEMLKRYRKGYKPDQIAQGLKVARDLGIRTVGTFLVGLPEETRESLTATAALARDLPLDFASFNVAVPRYGTLLRSEARAGGLIEDLRTMDQAGAQVAMNTLHMNREEVDRLKRKAVRDFYLRPSYLGRRLASVNSWWELKTQAREGLALLSRNRAL